MDIELAGKYVLCIHEEGNLSRAARKIGISQPALSIALSNLEKKLGYKIFDKSTLPFQLTTEGMIYVECLKRQQLAIKDYQQKLDEFYDDTIGTVTVGAPVVYVESMLIEAVAKLHQRYPKYHISIKNAPVPELITLTQQGEVDCFISTISNLPEHFEKVEIKKEEKIYMCIPKSWEINEKIKEFQTVPGEERGYFDYTLLEGMEFIFLEKEQPMHIELKNFLEQHKITYKNHIEVNQVSSGVAMTALGVGISLAQEEMLKNSIHLKDVCIYALPGALSGRTIYVTYDKNNYLSRACQNLIYQLENEES